MLIVNFYAILNKYTVDKVEIDFHTSFIQHLFFIFFFIKIYSAGWQPWKKVDMHAGNKIQEVQFISFRLGLNQTEHEFPDRTGPDPKFAGQVLPDRTESGLIFLNILPNKCRLSILIW